MVEEQGERETAMVRGPSRRGDGGYCRVLMRGGGGYGSVPSCGAEATVSRPSSWVGGLGKGAKETGNLGAEATIVGGGGGLGG